jgi:hypothetical protein
MYWLLDTAVGSIGVFLALEGHWIIGAVVFFAALTRKRG